MTGMGLSLPDRTPLLRSERVVLRGPVESDGEGYRLCETDPEITRLFGGTATSPSWQPPTDEEARAWYRRFAADLNPLRWVITEGDRFVDTCRLHSVDAQDRRARYAIGLLDRAALGIGFGTEVTNPVLGYGFGEVGLHRIDLRVLAFNERAIACYRRCGFVEEGRERESADIDGRWQDDLIMGILAREFTGRRQRDTEGVSVRRPGSR